MAGLPDGNDAFPDNRNDQTGRSVASGRLRMRVNLSLGRLITLAAPALGIVALFMSLSWFGIFRTVPEWLRLTLLLLFGLGFAVSLWPLGRYRSPLRAEIDARLEAENQIANQAIAVQDDQIEAADPVARALWDEHRRRMAGKIGALEAGLPRSDLPARDPWGIRVALALLLFVAFGYSFSGQSGKPGDAFVSHVRSTLPDMRIDVWITPPAYVNQAPVFLTGVARAEGEAVEAIAGSEITVRLGGADPDANSTVLWGADVASLAPLAPSNADGTARLAPTGAALWRFKPTSDGSLKIVAGGSEAAFAIRLIADEPPKAAFTAAPRRALNGALELDYTLSDDHGIARAEAEIVPAGETAPDARPLFDPPKYRLSLPRRSAEDNRATPLWARVSPYNSYHHPKWVAIRPAPGRPCVIRAWVICAGCKRGGQGGLRNSMADEPDVEALEKEILGAVSAAKTAQALEDVRVSALGKKGSVSLLMRGLGKMSADERKSMGPKLNGLKTRVGDAIIVRQEALRTLEITARLESERIDVTLPVRPGPLADGRIHPVSQVMDEVLAIFADMGFEVAEGPDIETDYFNFTALNIPEEHPARQMHDTFYFHDQAGGERRLLRTHTSPVQIRTLLNEKPPVRIIAPGRTYRCDSDQTHTPMFHQIEALVIDTETHMGHLKWTIEAFTRAFFEVDEVKMRLRPSYFPFTEPSAEVDIGCARLGNEIRIGEGDDWLEILGCGMVHPKVLQAVGLDPDVYQGYAFGMGIDRIAMLKYGIPDLRGFFDADLRWLKHYGFAPLDMPTLFGGLSR